MTVSRFLSAEGAMRRAVSDALADMDTPVTFALWRYLHLLGCYGPRCGLATLSCATGVHPQAVARDLAKLCQIGALTVEPHETDGRRRVYRLTDAGAQAEAQATAKAHQSLRRWGFIIGDMEVRHGGGR